MVSLEHHIFRCMQLLVATFVLVLMVGCAGVAGSDRPINPDIGSRSPSPIDSETALPSSSPSSELSPALVSAQEAFVEYMNEVDRLFQNGGGGV